MRSGSTARWPSTGHDPGRACTTSSCATPTSTCRSPSSPTPPSSAGSTPRWPRDSGSLVHAKPDFWTGRGSLSMRAREIRPVGLGALLARAGPAQGPARRRGAVRRRAQEAAAVHPEPDRADLRSGQRRDGRRAGQRARALAGRSSSRYARSPVQGVQAVPAVTAALAELDAMPEVDVIILTRGGGSVEDLLPFSNEALVRAVAACRTPVVSAIGHEQDAPLVDFVADLRASTPTDAAKRVVPSLREQPAPRRRAATAGLARPAPPSRPRAAGLLATDASGRGDRPRATRGGRPATSST